VYWSETLGSMLPHGVGILGLRSTCLGRVGDLGAALDVSRQALRSWPSKDSYRNNFLMWAKRNQDALNDEDRALVEFLTGNSPAPDESMWSSDGVSHCSCDTRLYLDVSVEEQVSGHFEPLLARPVVAARCRHSAAAWIFVEMTTGAYRGVRLPNVVFTEVPMPATEALSAIFR
jgi:hypothetical protein